MIFGRKEKVVYKNYRDYKKSPISAQWGDVMLKSPFPNGEGAVFVSKRRAIDQVPERNDRIRYYDFMKNGDGYTISGIQEGQYRFNSWKKLLIENGFWKEHQSIEGVVA